MFHAAFNGTLNWHLLVQKQLWKHRNNVRNLYETPEWRQWYLSGVFIVNYEQISHILLVFPLLTLKN